MPQGLLGPRLSGAACGMSSLCPFRLPGSESQAGQMVGTVCFPWLARHAEQGGDPLEQGCTVVCG